MPQLGRMEWLRRLARLFYPHGQIRRVWRGPGRSLRFVTTPGSSATYAFFLALSWVRRIQKEIPPGSVLYDVGGNTGHIAMLLARIAGTTGQVYSFEPSPAPREVFARNLALNPDIAVSIVPVALADRTGSLSFVVPENRDSEGALLLASHNHAQRSDLRQITVQSITLDEFVRTHAIPHFIKIDVEGAAEWVLAGARQLLRDHAPRMYIELHNTAERDGAWRLLQESGYQCYTDQGQRIMDLTACWHSPIWCSRQLDPPTVMAASATGTPP
ncbi:MAG: FkbM family methyltransferase [Magnetococcus sp. WYHC-3]